MRLLLSKQTSGNNHHFQLWRNLFETMNHFKSLNSRFVFVAISGSFALFLSRFLVLGVSLALLLPDAPTWLHFVNVDIFPPESNIIWSEHTKKPNGIIKQTRQVERSQNSSDIFENQTSTEVAFLFLSLSVSVLIFIHIFGCLLFVCSFISMTIITLPWIKQPEANWNSLAVALACPFVLSVFQ